MTRVDLITGLEAGKSKTQVLADPVSGGGLFSGLEKDSLGSLLYRH